MCPSSPPLPSSPAALPTPDPLAAPSVGVVVPTRDRPELVRRALRSIVEQRYPGRVEVLVVHDGTEPDTSLAAADPERLRDVRVLANTRTPGLAGARNTGILALDTDFVAFCDDDDHWHPDKLARQVRRALGPDRPEMVTCAIEVDFEGRRSTRLAGRESVGVPDLTRSILAMLHSSCMLFDRQALVHGIGLVSEEIPGSQNEDWDIKLRAAARAPIAHVDEPLTVVQWGRTSHFSRAWDSKIRSWEWMLERHPAIAADRRGASRVHGQLAFAEAARGDRRAAARWSRTALRGDPRQWRAVLALLVAAGVVRPERVLDTLHRFGRGV